MTQGSGEMHFPYCSAASWWFWGKKHVCIVSGLLLIQNKIYLLSIVGHQGGETWSDISHPSMCTCLPVFSGGTISANQGISLVKLLGKWIIYEFCDCKNTTHKHDPLINPSYQPRRCTCVATGTYLHHHLHLHQSVYRRGFQRKNLQCVRSTTGVNLGVVSAFVCNFSKSESKRKGLMLQRHKWEKCYNIQEIKITVPK